VSGNRGQPAQTYLLSVISLGLVVAMVLYPDVAFQAAVKGLDVWWNVVFPALLPFFIGAQLLMGLGVVHLMGVLLEPLMRPLFNVPGTGAFVMAMGLASGYPIGSVLTGRLRRHSIITRAEAERLMSFTNTADPLFMSGAVAVGMFGSAALSGIIMVSHYISSLLTGLVLRFYNPQAPVTQTTESREPLFKRALNELLRARHEDGRPLGELMGDCVRDSVNTLLVIGGFIVVFSVVIRILTAVGLVEVMASFFTLLLRPLCLDVDTSAALVSGFFEITLGTQLAAQAAAPLKHQVVIASAIIAWSGLSVHAQVAAMVRGTDINLTPYIFSRVFHAVTAGLCTMLLWPFLGQYSTSAFVPRWWWTGRAFVEVGLATKLGYSTRLFVTVTVGLVLGAVLLYVLRAVRVFVLWLSGPTR